MDDEAGTTLTELLVVILLLGVVGAVTTTGIVQGFNAQLTSTNVAETLDGTRIATQRVREFVRGATEVCSNSDAGNLVLWTDDNGDGTVADAEIDIFELFLDGGTDVFQRRVPLSGADEVQLIRDDIINNAVFTYDVVPGTQPLDLNCQREDSSGTLVVPDGTGDSRTRSVGVTFEVQNPDPSEPNLTTSTTIQVRNASLQAIAGTTPAADFTINCPAGTEQCSFDGSASSDPDGLVVDWLWEFGDGTTGTGKTITHTYAEGNPAEYWVRLTVRDDDNFSNSLRQLAKPGVTSGNAVPLAQIVYSCTGLQCTFDGTGSTDTDGTIVDYQWDFGNGETATGATPATVSYAAEGPYTVSLTVTDDGTTEASNKATVTVQASNNVLIVEQMQGSGSPLDSAAWNATITVQLGLTTAATVGEGVNISVGATGGNGANSVKRVGSCSTNALGKCDITIESLAKQVDPLRVTIAQVTDPQGRYVYDADQNKQSCIVVSPGAIGSVPPECKAA